MISSRMPEGEWNRCPVCQSTMRIEPSQPFGDATCPACGSLLWFLAASDDARFFPRDEASQIEERLAALVAERLGIDPAAVRDGKWQELGIDFLDWVELVMEVEEE